VYFDHNGEKPHWGWSWLERWMAARPWENRALKEPSNATTPMRKEREKSVEMMTTDSRSVQSYTDDSPPPLQQHRNYDNNNNNNNNNSGSSKRTSPITTTLLQLQRQQQRMLHGAAAGYDQADSDCSSTPGSNSNTPSNSENLHTAAKRSYMATTKAAQAKIRSQSAATNNNVRTPAEEVDLQTKKKRFSLPAKEKDKDQGRESSIKPGSTGRLSTSPNASLGTTPRATNSRSASQYAASDKASQSHRCDKSSSQTYKFEKSSTRRSDHNNNNNMQLNSSYNSDPRPSRRQGGDFMSSSYNVERGSRKASEILAMAYKADQTRPSSYKSGRDSFTQHSSYNGGNSSSSSRPSRRNEDFLTTSYNNDSRPRRSVDIRQQPAASHDSSRSDKDDFLAHYNAEMSRKKQGDLMHQSLNYERPSQRSSNTHHPQAQRHSRKSGEFNSKTDRPSSRGGDFMQRSYQSDRPMYRSGDFTGSSLTSSYGDFRKPFR
jgi:hypothetical protein